MSDYDTRNLEDYTEDMHPHVTQAMRDRSPSKIPLRMPRDLSNYKPSKLDLMKEEYQRKIMREKEKKIIEMYESNQKKALERVSRIDNKAKRGNSVRNFFEERRALESSGTVTGKTSSMKEIQDQFNRYKKDKQEKQDNVRRNSLPSVPKMAGKRSAGRDRDHLLAPIGMGDAEKTRPVYAKQQITRHVSSSKNGKRRDSTQDSTQFSAVKSKSAPVSGKMKQIDINSMNPTKSSDSYSERRSSNSSGSSSSPDRAQLAALKRKNSFNKKEPLDSISVEVEEKLTDFQKWQLEQVRIKEERLHMHRQRSLGKLSASEKDESDEGIDSDREKENVEDEILKKQTELMDKINKQQEDLEHYKVEKEKRANQEKRDEEKRQQKIIIEREKNMKKMKDRQKRQDDRERKRMEEEEGAARKMEEQIKREEEMKRESETESPPAFRTYRRDDHESSQTSSSPPAKQFQPRPPASKKPANRPPPRRRSPPVEPLETEKSLTPIPGPDIEYYTQAAAEYSSDAAVSVQLVQCQICDRSFAAERLAKHEAACKVSHKKRKVFDPTKMRTQGTEMAKYVTAAKKKEQKPSPKKQNWRIKRENFIKSIQYAKKVTDIEKKGGNIRDLTPPPTTVNPDYVKCQHCERTFNITAAERHIPRCQEIKGRPAIAKKNR